MDWKKFLPSVCCCLLAFFAGALIGGFTGRPAGEGQMLASGAIVVFHMLIGGVFGLALAGYLTWRWPAEKLWKLAGALFVSTLLLGYLTRLAVKKRQALGENRQEELSHQQFPAAVSETVLVATTDTLVRGEYDFGPEMIDRGQDEEGELLRGYGFVSLPFGREGMRILFYSDNQLHTRPYDSLIYTRESNLNILRYAPPYLVPFYLKEDYDSALLRLLGVGENRVLVELNAETGRRAWVDKQAVNISFWPEFLSEVFAVHPLNAENNPVRAKPLDGAAVATNISLNEYHLLLSEEVVGDWIRVRSTLEGDAEEGSTGWLRWRRGNRLLIGWNYRL